MLLGSPLNDGNLDSADIAVLSTTRAMLNSVTRFFFSRAIVHEARSSCSSSYLDASSRNKIAILVPTHGAFVGTRPVSAESLLFIGCSRLGFGVHGV